RIEGRANDSIVTPDGRVINSLALIYPVREVVGIEQFRIIQKKVDQFRIEIVRNGDFQAEGEWQIRESWSKLLRSPIDVTFEYPLRLQAERSGKFRHVVSEVPAGRTMANASTESSPTSKPA